MEGVEAGGAAVAAIVELNALTERKLGGQRYSARSLTGSHSVADLRRYRRQSLA